MNKKCFKTYLNEQIALTSGTPVPCSVLVLGTISKLVPGDPSDLDAS